MPARSNNKKVSMNIIVNDELQAYIDPLTADERQALERSIVDEGCRDALVLWGEILVDGHNRYSICQQHGIAFQTVQNTRFQSLQDVKLWMIDHHLGRRSLSDFQRGVLALRKKEITSARAMAAALAPTAAGESTSAAELPPPERLNTRESIAKAARISSNTVMQIEKIQKTAVPELVAAVKAGTISINTAATLASMPAAEQVAAAAGGKSDLQQAAKRVRQGRAKPAASEAGPDASPDEAPEDVALRNRETQLLLLQSTVQQLTAENKALQEENRQLRAQLAAAL